MSMSSDITCLLLLLTVHGSIQRSSPSSATYRGAVVELGAIYHKNDSSKTLTDNAKKYLGFIEQAAAKAVDIVVFPELGLPSLYIEERSLTLPRCTLIPAPSQNYTPCDDTSVPVHEAVRMISCGAQRHAIYVVVNLFEKEECSGGDCPSDGYFVYITSVVFDRSGKIISRGRKFHLIDTFGLMRATNKSQLSKFDTDFGVTFGNVVCFDLMFEEPTLTLTRKMNITDIVVSSGLYVVMPFLSTIQLEAGWAFSEDVNLLAAGHNRVETAHSGSGIYAGREGVLTAILPFDPHDELLIADIKKKTRTIGSEPAVDHQGENDVMRPNAASEYQLHSDPGEESESHKANWIHGELDGCETKVITEDGFVSAKVNQNGLDCTFHVNLTNLRPPLTYRLFAYNGLHASGNLVALGTRVCAIVQCANETIDSCGHIKHSSVTFNFIEITASYVDNARTLMMPNTLGTDMFPLKNWSTNRYKDKGRIYETIALTANTRNLVTFGFWGRNFETDESSIQNY